MTLWHIRTVSWGGLYYIVSTPRPRGTLSLEMVLDEDDDDDDGWWLV